MAFDVGAVGVGRVGYLMHSGSVVQGFGRSASDARWGGFDGGFLRMPESLSC
jgi:hypothetical protein